MLSTLNFIDNLPNLPARKDLVAFCKQKAIDSPSSRGFPYPTANPTHFIKCAAGATAGEVATQDHAFKHFYGNSFVKIPKIYDHFTDGMQLYIVMEYIDGETVAKRLSSRPAEADKTLAKVAEAINQLLLIRLPHDGVVSPGPVGGGVIMHPFFKDSIAPTEYASVDELAGHIQRLLQINSSPFKVDLSSEPLMFYYSDIDAHNFLINNDDEVYIVDFREAGFLPECFMAFVFNPELITPFKEKLQPMVTWEHSKNLKRSENLQGLGYASYILWIHSNRNIGLPEPATESP